MTTTMTVSEMSTPQPFNFSEAELEKKRVYTGREIRALCIKVALAVSRSYEVNRRRSKGLLTH